ncbi:MAG: hypothetical protein ACI8UO_004560 [Verrucomicrobiales bacterium]|jgi:hypothetical protein
MVVAFLFSGLALGKVPAPDARIQTSSSISYYLDSRDYGTLAIGSAADLIEYRYNGFEDAGPGSEGGGVAFGARFHF